MSNQNPFDRQPNALKSALGGLGTTLNSDAFAAKSALGGLGTTLASDAFAAKNALGGFGTTLASDAFAAKNALPGLGTTLASDAFAAKNALGGFGTTLASDAFAAKNALPGLGTTLASDAFAAKSALGGLGTTLASDAFAAKNALPGLGGVSNAFAAPQTSHIPTRSSGPSHGPTPSAAVPQAAASVPRQQQESATKLSRAADLGSIVRSARKALALNQQEFADLAGVGRRFVSELESGKPSLEFDKVLRCCAAAGIDILAAPRRLA